MLIPKVCSELVQCLNENGLVCGLLSSVQIFKQKSFDGVFVL